MKIKEKAEQLYSLLGILPSRELEVRCETISIEEKETYIVERLVLYVGDEHNNPGGEPIPAYFVKPYGTGKYKTVLFSHSHGGFYRVGKEELFHPAPYMFQKPYVEDITEQGYAVMAIDHYCFGERFGRTESATFKDMLWKGQVMWGKMVYDSLKALDYLCSRSDVNPNYIAAIGMSMGSTMSYWISALDERIRCCADIGCLTDFDEIVKQGYLDEHGIYYYVPGLRNHFTASDINSLIAPHPRFAAVGIYDHLTPIVGVERIENDLYEVYEKLNARSDIKIKHYPTGHLETAQVRKDLMGFLVDHM